MFNKQRVRRYFSRVGAYFVPFLILFYLTLDREKDMVLCNWFIRCSLLTAYAFEHGYHGWNGDVIRGGEGERPPAAIGLFVLGQGLIHGAGEVDKVKVHVAVDVADADQTVSAASALLHATKETHCSCTTVRYRADATLIKLLL